MDYKHFLSLIEQAYVMGIDTVSPFGFGEPLIDKNLSSKIATCHTMGFDTFITTNATLLTTEKAQDLLLVMKMEI